MSGEWIRERYIRGSLLEGVIVDEAWLVPTEEDMRRLRRASIVDDINSAMRAQDYAEADRLFREYAELLDGEMQ